MSVRSILALLLMTAAPLLGGCSVNPATGARSFTLLSWNEERALGAEAAPQFTQEFGGAVPDADLQAYVDDVGRRLLPGVEKGVPQLDWEFTLLDSSVANAFALPGGKIFFSRGLAEKLEDEAEMAGVIGHEIGHVTARHGNQRMSAQLGLNILLAGLAVGVEVATDENSDARRAAQVGIPALALGGNVVMLKYGRDEELEADRLGMRYMRRADYDPAAQRDVMLVLQSLSAGGGGAAPPEWLSTHPASATRIKQIDKLLAGEYAATQNNPAFQRNADAYVRRMLYGLDRLPAPAHGRELAGAPDDTGDTAVLWCAHCRLALTGADRFPTD